MNWPFPFQPDALMSSGHALSPLRGVPKPYPVILGWPMVFGPKQRLVSAMMVAGVKALMPFSYKRIKARSSS